jgi:hypothetical protein
MLQGLFFVFAEKFKESAFRLIFFIKADGEIAAGCAKRVEEVRIRAVAVVVRVVHG